MNEKDELIEVIDMDTVSESDSIDEDADEEPDTTLGEDDEIDEDSDKEPDSELSDED